MAEGKAKGSLQSELPDVARWVDWLRDQLGKETVDAQIKRSMAGQPGFAVYSTDGRDPPLLIGTLPLPDPPGAREFNADEWLAFVHEAGSKSESAR
jgi:hypothetical protein